MLLRTLTALSLLALAACGGSGGPTIQPVASSGFASASDVIGRGDVFVVRNANFATSDVTDGNLVENQRLTTSDISMSIAEDGSSVTLVVEGETYTLLPNPTSLDYSTADGTPSGYLLRIFRPTTHVETIFFAADRDDRLRSGFFIAGFDTDPSVVAAQTGRATLNGEIDVLVKFNGRTGFGRGPGEIIVSFDADTLSGSFDLESASTPTQLRFPTSTLTLEQTRITGNGFAGSIDLDLLEGPGNVPGLTFVNGAYEGRIYGSDAQSAAGTVTGNLTLDGFDEPVLLQGAFIATE